MEFSRQEYWSGLPFPSSGDLPNPGIKPRSPALQAISLLYELPGKLWASSRSSFLHSGQQRRINRRVFKTVGFPGGSDGKASACNVGDPVSIPGSGRSPGEGNGNPFQHSCLENSMDRGAWWATVHGVAKSRTQWSDFTPLLLQRNFPTQGSNPGVLHRRQVLHRLS